MRLPFRAEAAAYDGVMETRRCELADPALPLGMIERGRGAGFLWAREHPEEARPLLYACLEHDPRLFPQVELRTEYWVELAQAIGFGPRDLEPLLLARAQHPVWTRETGDDPPFTLLAGLALAGDQPVRALVHAQIREGPNWIPILEHISWLADRDKAFPIWLELAEAVLARVTDSDEGKALQETRPDFVEEFMAWPLWNAGARLEAFARDNWEELEAIAESMQSPAEDVVVVPTKGFLARQAAAELVRAARADEAGVSALHAVLREESDLATWAWRHLGWQGDASALEIAVDQLGSLRFRSSARRLYLEGLPAETTLPLARQLVTRNDEASTRMGWTLLARHAAQSDVPLLHAELVSRVAAGDYRDISSVICGLTRHPGCGPYPAARTCFEAADYASARSAAARLLSAGDCFTDLAFECLWDSELSTRQLAARVIAPTTREIRDRLASIPAARSDS
jgi:hypothetical protein